MAEKASDDSLENRIRRSDWEMSLIKEIAFDLYFHPCNYAPRAFSIAHEMVHAMFTWRCETSYHQIIAGVLQFFVSYKFVVLPVMNPILPIPVLIVPFVPEIQFSWMNFQGGEGYSVLSTNYRLQLGPQTYMLRLDHFSPLNESSTVTIYFWCEGSGEDTGRGVVLRMEIVNRFLGQKKWMWLAFYIASEMSSAFSQKLKIAAQNECENSEQNEELVSPYSEPDNQFLVNEDHCHSNRNVDTLSMKMKWAQLV